MKHPSLTVLSLAPYRFGTRSRKIAATFASDMTVRYVAPAKVGRTGRWDNAGQWMTDNVHVIQVTVGRIRSKPSYRNMLGNLFLSYLPAYGRMLVETLKEPSDVVVANGPAVLPLALAHKTRFKSRIILDFPERPGMVTATGSLAAVLSRFEKVLLRSTTKLVEQVLVVTYADVKTLESYGFPRVDLVRNVPMNSWKAESVAPPISFDEKEHPLLRIIAMGSVFEGRGYENLIRAVGLATRNIPIKLVICGPGREDYIDNLKNIALNENVHENVEFLPPVMPSEVSKTYLEADIGLVLYESLDPGNDGLSNKLFECVSSGRPVIASNLPENYRFVSENGVGWLTGDSPEEISRTIMQSYDSKVLVQMASHCRELGDRELNWEQEVKPIRGIIDRY